MEQIEIIESFIQGKTNDEECEDGIVVTDDFVAVIDGVTSKTDFRYDGKKTGLLAKNMISHVIPTLAKDDKLSQVVEKINFALKTLTETIALEETQLAEHPQAAAAIYSRHYHQIWMIADCQALVNDRHYQNNKISDDYIAAFRSFVLTVLKDNKPHESMTYLDQSVRSEIEPWLIAANQYANRENSKFGYSVFNGQAIPLSLIEVIQVPDQVREIVLASDGYPKLFDNLADSEAYLTRFLEEDPYGLDKHYLTKGYHPGNHSFDDRAYIRFISNP